MCIRDRRCADPVVSTQGSHSLPIAEIPMNKGLTDEGMAKIDQKAPSQLSSCLLYTSTLKIAPSYESGKLGIGVIIDESTNDHEVEITVPSEWI